MWLAAILARLCRGPHSVFQQKLFKQSSDFDRSIGEIMGSNEQMLKSYLSKYKYADIAKKDILGVFSQYKDLRPTHGPFTTTAANRPGSNMTVTEEHLRMSLLSAVEDKMKRRLREIFEQAQQVRELSRQQFMKRALIQKCREKAGLPPLA
ncbi:STP22 [Mytilus edulis]|uniref:TSG101 n=1 Tax=Mytilus edulis TaxID=6550 RepID=A0A8S3U7E3_MYTED|nr:STP22 [Mytilus edulis]